jgi:hypothetical protein
MTHLSGFLKLDTFEQRVLVASAAPEVDLSFEALYGYVQNDVNRKRPIVDLLLKIFLGSASGRVARRSTLSAAGTFLKRGFIRAVESQPPDNQSFLARGLRTDDRITDFLRDAGGNINVSLSAPPLSLVLRLEGIHAEMYSSPWIGGEICILPQNE